MCCTGTICSTRHAAVGHTHHHASYREFVFDGTEEYVPTEEELAVAQAKADLEARQRHQMEQVYVRALCPSHACPPASFLLSTHKIGYCRHLSAGATKKNFTETFQRRCNSSANCHAVARSVHPTSAAFKQYSRVAFDRCRCCPPAVASCVFIADITVLGQ